MRKVLVFAYNSSIHATTEFELYYLMFSQKPTLLVDTVLKPIESSSDTLLSDYVFDLRSKWKNAHEFAKILSDRTHEINARKYYENRIPVKLRVGDLVFVRNEAETVGSTHKRESKYRGPYRVLTIRNVVNCELERIDKSKRKSQTDIYHVSKLKHYREYDQDVEKRLVDWKERLTDKSIRGTKHSMSKNKPSSSTDSHVGYTSEKPSDEDSVKDVYIRRSSRKRITCRKFLYE